MTGRVRRVLATSPRVVATVAAVTLAAATACGAPVPAGPAVSAVPAVRVDLPGGEQPEVIATSGADLLVGVRRDGTAPLPGLLLLGRDGRVSEVPSVAASGYGRTASWYSLAVDAGHVTAIGGDRGGAHGNVRWSVWSGSATGVAEQEQAFSTFGGWGAGDLIDAVPTPAGAVLVGSWQSDTAGLDVAVWTAGGTTWSRQPSTGTALASTRADLGFATHATPAGAGVLITGWEFAAARGGQAPAVWRSSSGAAGWTRTLLPGADASGVAMSGRCSGADCVVAGRVGGMLALWRLTGDTWSRVMGVPAVPVGDDAVLPAPLLLPGGIAQLTADGGHIDVVDVTAAGGSLRRVDGPTGVVTAAVDDGSAVHLLAGPGDADLTLWRLDTAVVAAAPA